MRDLQRRLDDLRYQLQNTDDQAELARLEELARELLADSKNTPQETATQELFAEIARMNNPASPSSAAIRGLVRRARIRIEIAGDADDIDEAIDILAEALQLSPSDADVIDLLQQAAADNAQAERRVSDLFARYGVEADTVVDTSPPKPTYPHHRLTNHPHLRHSMPHRLAIHDPKKRCAKRARCVAPLDGCRLMEAIPTLTKPSRN